MRVSSCRRRRRALGMAECDVRRKIVKTGDVDVVISIGSNFFYTRSVPASCGISTESKPANRRKKILMLNARNVYRKVTRKINDFSPEQMQNLSAIVWLNRGQRERFLTLVGQYLRQVLAESAAIEPALKAFEGTLTWLKKGFEVLAETVRSSTEIDEPQKRTLAEADIEMIEASRCIRKIAKRSLRA